MFLNLISIKIEEHIKHCDNFNALLTFDTKWERGKQFRNKLNKQTMVSVLNKLIVLVLTDLLSFQF